METLKNALRKPNSSSFQTTLEIQTILQQQKALCCHCCDGADDYRPCDSRFNETNKWHRAQPVENIKTCPTLRREIGENNVKITLDPESETNTHIHLIQVTLTARRQLELESFLFSQHTKSEQSPVQLSTEPC